jgi:hypothetical protein
VKDVRVKGCGVYHCPNALCLKTGSAWFRQTLSSFENLGFGESKIDQKEWLLKGREANKKNGIEAQNFERNPRRRDFWRSKNKCA